MSEKNERRLRRIWGVVLSAGIIAAGGCLMVQCFGIYSMGDHPFSRETVAAAFGMIAVPVWLCLGLILAAFILEAVLPQKDRELLRRPTAMVLAALQKKTQASPEVMKLRSKRRMLGAVTVALAAVGGLVFAGYAFREGSFHQSLINESMIRAMMVLAACMALPFGFGVWASYSGIASMKQEIALLKQAPKQAQQVCPAPRSSKIRWVVLALAAALLIYGAMTGGTADVLTKAVNICTECVGLG